MRNIKDMTGRELVDHMNAFHSLLPLGLLAKKLLASG